MLAGGKNHRQNLQTHLHVYEKCGLLLLLGTCLLLNGWNFALLEKTAYIFLWWICVWLFFFSAMQLL
jgi:hypothetical protein